MPTLTTREAVERLTRAAEAMSPDDLLEFYKELFPEDPKSELSPGDGGASDRRKVVEYLHHGLEVEEILDLWNVAFPKAWNASYDDETGTIQYDDEPGALHSAD